MKKIKVVSKKYDGSLRDEVECDLYSQVDDTIIVFSPPGTKGYDYRKKASFEAPDGLLQIYFKNRWYNVWHICEQMSHQNLIYTNIAMPATLEAGVLQYVDLDLDYRVHMDGEIELKDEDEFEQNIQRFGYPRHVIAKARTACNEVIQHFESGNFPFNHSEQIALYQRIKRDLSPAEEHPIAGRRKAP